MDKKYWLNQIEPNELEYLFVVSNLISKNLNCSLSYEDIPDSLIIVQDNGINVTAGFYVSNEDYMETVADWFKGKDILVEASYDQMVKLFDILGRTHLPDRYYLFKYLCDRELKINRKLDFRVVNKIQGNEKLIIEGLKESLSLKRKDISLLIKNPNFLEYLNRGLYIFMKDDNLVGFIFTKHLTNNYVEFGNIFVKKRYRGKGYSNEMIKTMVQIFKEKNLCSVATIKHDNYGVIKLYEDENFELEGIFSREKLK